MACPVASRLSGALLGAIVSLWGVAVQAAPSWYLELPPNGPSESVTRRTLALELRDVTVPPDPIRPDDGPEQVHLHIRVSAADDGFVVEVWDRGDSAGRRTISASGPPAIVGRRAALAAVELTRLLAASRRRVARDAERERRLQEKIREAERLERLRFHAGASGRFEALWVPQGAWLVGPTVAAELNRHLPIRLRFGLGWLAGGLPILRGAPLAGGSPSWSLLDLHVEGLWLSEPQGTWELELGGQFGVGAVHVGGATEVDGITGQRDTWTARMGLEVAALVPLADQISGRVELGAGALLRPIPLRYGGTEERLGGLYVGAGLGAVIRPSLIGRRMQGRP